MNGIIDLEDLKRVVGHFRQDRLRKHVEEGDDQSIVRVVGCIASTLASGKSVDPNEDMLRTSEAKALAGYLRGKYRARAQRAEARKKRDGARADADARHALMQMGEKVTEARVAALVELDEQYAEHSDYELAAAEVSDLIQELRYALGDRHEVLVEISRNIRAISRGTEEPQ